MNVVLLSGGSGKRLWPISNDTRSKQFLKVIQNERGETESMVQRVWRQLDEQGLGQSALISTGRAQVDLIINQLGEDTPYIVEPERRDTFAAIALASAYLFSVQNVARNEVVVVQPVDAFVENRFFDRLKALEAHIVAGGYDLGLIGVTPTFPSEKYGYIVPDASGQAVTRFVEKPAQDLAAQLIAEHGALWNCGVFAFPLGFVIGELERRGLPTDYHVLLEQFSSLPKRSFDYEVVEHASNIGVIQYDGDWKDLGTWSTLTDEMGVDVLGRGSLHEGSERTQIINELDLDVKVLGISDAIVAVSADGILVSNKDKSAKIKDYLDADMPRPMFEERRWGWYRVLDFVRDAEGTDVLTKRIKVDAGKNLSLQSHNHRSEVWTVISGEGEFILNDTLRKVKKGDVLHIQVGDKHGIKATSDLEFIEVQMGTPLIEEDIIRYAMDWESAVASLKN